MTTADLDIARRICVRHPYLAFHDLTVLTPGHTTATLPVESPTAKHRPFELHEFVRHGAILGLTAVASLAPTDERRYYLAQRGTAAWLAQHSDPTINPVTVSSDGRMMTNRRGAATTTAYANGTPLALLSVEFSVLSEKAFRRMFAHAYRPHQDTSSPHRSPYTHPLPLDQLHIGADTATATATVSATPHQCAGHFDHYPALPIAVLVRSCFDLATQLIHTLEPDESWDITDGDLHPVTHLVPAGQPVALRAEIIHSTPLSRMVRIALHFSNTEIGHLTVQTMRSHRPKEAD